MPKKKTYQLYLDAPLRGRMDKHAFMERRSLANWMISVLCDYMDRYEGQETRFDDMVKSGKYSGPLYTLDVGPSIDGG